MRRTKTVVALRTGIDDEGDDDAEEGADGPQIRIGMMM
jgi:hypothetical protein